MEFTNVSFSIDLDNGNSGLVDDPGSAVANILRKIANEIDGEITSDDLEQSATIFDINGNTVGAWYMTCEGGEPETCDNCGETLQGDENSSLCDDCATEAAENAEIKARIYNLDREACIELLISVCIESDDNDDIGTLREAIESALVDGDIEASQIE